MVTNSYLNMLPAAYSLVIQFFVFCAIIDLSHQVALKGEKVRDARTEEFPSVVSIGAKSTSRRNNHFCTGTLISEKHVLTAAHCLANLYPVGVDVTVGSIDIEQGTKHYPSHWRTYKEWKGLSKYETVVHDIAIITLNSTVRGIEPSILTKRENLTGSILKIAGWGYTNNDEKPTKLKTSSLKVISNDECNAQLSALTNHVVSVNEYNLCSKSEPWILTDCGDSGGPSFDEENNLVGVTVGRCPLHEYFVYPPVVLEQNQVVLQMNANRYRDFIASVTKKP